EQLTNNFQNNMDNFQDLWGTVVNQLGQTINNNDLETLFINDNTPINSFDDYTTGAGIHFASTPYIHSPTTQHSKLPFQSQPILN
ncbi:10927_t:CDS:1, partial [Cetraspora pellucida]